MTISFAGEVKPSATCRKILRHVKDPLRYDKNTDKQNSMAISRQVSTCFATRSLLKPEQGNQLGESEMIRNQMGNTIDQKMIADVWDAL
jgi:hypothetical protein